MRVNQITFYGGNKLKFHLPKGQYTTFEIQDDEWFYVGDLIKYYPISSKKGRAKVTRYKEKGLKRYIYYLRVWSKTEKVVHQVPKDKERSWEYQVDHIVSIKYGYDNNIEPDLIGSAENLQMLSRVDNMRKANNLTNKAVELLKIWGCYKIKKVS